MKIIKKIPLAKNAIRFISTHDDAPMDQVEKALDELIAFIQSERAQAVERRAQKEAEEIKEGEQ